ncbi:tail terminator [Gordonia phage Malibo]|nr:tail terminator [Gordonia phage Malibo]
MRPAVQPADAAQLVKDWLKPVVATRFPSVAVRLEHDDNWALGSDPELVVFDDSGPLDQWPVNTRPTIRVTSWTTGRDLQYIHHALGLMLCNRIPGIASVLPGTAVLETRDSKTGADLASFTVRTRVRTIAL